MVIPLHDENPTRNIPVVTWMLIAVNVVVFLASPVVLSPLTRAAAGNLLCEQVAYYQRWGTIPAELTHGHQLSEAPGPAVSPTSCAAVPTPYHKNVVLSTLTGLFIHAGWLHLIGNMLFLWVFGNNVEDRFGRLRFLLFYLTVGVIATCGYALATPGSTAPLVGASGAISGILGAYLMLYPRARVLTLIVVIPIWMRAWFVLLVWFAIQAINAQGSLTAGDTSIGYGVHIIGFLLGVGYGALRRLRSPPVDWTVTPSA
ncbi:MAG TPA: rhomboid family intramembrane serine protease [Mycobacteriales bacterium]|nr:rhomboid family intramembrane serine protease [Mycobacteriales bacterium]